MMKKIRKVIMSFTLALLSLFMCLPCYVTTAYADGIGVEGGFTSVLDDLRKDEKFTEADYPIVENNYELEVITISESVDKELFVYVYQPHPEHGKYVASSINISATLHDSLSIKNYGLSLVSCEGVFQKYLVMGLTLPSGTVRYYDVVSIYRAFDGTIDAGIDDDNGNTINEVVFKVAKQYTISDTEDGTVMRVADTDVVEVTDKFVGFVRYSGGWGLVPEWCDSHFVAFSTSREIDKLFEADVYYTTQSYYFSWGPYVEDTTTYGEKEPQYAYINYTQGLSYNGEGWFGESVLRDRIVSADEFIKNETYENIYECGIFNVVEKNELSDVAKTNLESKQWVLRFVETVRETNPTAQYSTSTIVGDVSILRLKFETDGVTYNLGVVDNKQTGSRNPVNEKAYEMQVADWFKIVIALLALILVLYVLGPFLPIIFSFIGGILKLALKIITLPFRLLFGGRRR